MVASAMERVTYDGCRRHIRGGSTKRPEPPMPTMTPLRVLILEDHSDDVEVTSTSCSARGFAPAPRGRPAGRGLCRRAPAGHRRHHRRLLAARVRCATSPRTAAAAGHRRAVHRGHRHGRRGAGGGVRPAWSRRLRVEGSARATRPGGTARARSPPAAPGEAEDRRGTGRERDAVSTVRPERAGHHLPIPHRGPAGVRVPQSRRPSADGFHRRGVLRRSVPGLPPRGRGRRSGASRLPGGRAPLDGPLPAPGRGVDLARGPHGRSAR